MKKIFTDDIICLFRDSTGYIEFKLKCTIKGLSDKDIERVFMQDDFLNTVLDPFDDDIAVCDTADIVLGFIEDNQDISLKSAETLALRILEFTHDVIEYIDDATADEKKYVADIARKILDFYSKKLSK